jgi:hypothetical protein
LFKKKDSPKINPITPPKTLITLLDERVANLQDQKAIERVATQSVKLKPNKYKVK